MTQSLFGGVVELINHFPYKNSISYTMILFTIVRGGGGHKIDFFVYVGIFGNN